MIVSYGEYARIVKRTNLASKRVQLILAVGNSELCLTNLSLGRNVHDRLLAHGWSV